MPALSQAPPHATSLHRFQRLRRRVVLLGGLIIAALAASSVYDAWRAYGDARATIEREIDNESRTLA